MPGSRCVEVEAGHYMQLPVLIMDCVVVFVVCSITTWHQTHLIKVPASAPPPAAAQPVYAASTAAPSAAAAPKAARAAEKAR